MNLFAYSELQIMIFFSALVRVSCLIFLLPIFGSNSLPGVIKILLSFMITVVLFPYVHQINAGIDMDTFSSIGGIIVMAVKECVVGLVVGFIAKVFFDSISFAFTFMGMQMGLNIASSYDPHMESGNSVVSAFYGILITLLFVSSNSHHLLLKAVAETFTVVPLGGLSVSKNLSLYAMQSVGDTFWIVVKMSAPMAFIIFLVNAAFGVISKAIPQINVLVVSFSVNILVGFTVFLVTMPLLGTTMDEIVNRIMTGMQEVLRYLHA